MERIEEVLTVPLQLTESLRRLANEAGSFRQECAELKTKAETLAQRLRAIARVSSDGSGGLYRRPMRRILHEAEKSLNKALALVRKCNRNGVIKRVITITSANDFKRVNVLLDNSIADITWLLNVSASGENRVEPMGLPPIASSEPMMGYFWEQIALLQRGTTEQREEAANALGDLARDNERFAKIIVEEDAVSPMLKVLVEGSPSAREAAARALGHLAKDADIVKQMMSDGVAPVFVLVLVSSPMKVQAAVAGALADMLAWDRTIQEIFLEQGAIRPLVALLGENIEEPQGAQPAVSMHTLVTSIAATKTGVDPSEQPTTLVAKPNLRNKPDKTPPPSSSALKPVNGANGAGASERRLRNAAGRTKFTNSENGRGLTQWELNRRERENEDPEVKAKLKSEVARALWMLAKGNPRTSKSITETKALLCFATLMEKGKGAVQLNSAMAVMEIAAVAEHEVDLRRAAFKMSSPAAKAVVDQLLRLAEDGGHELQVACIKAIGCLSRTFPARETRVVKPLVKRLESTEAIAAEAVMALEKFACTDNFLHTEHSKAIIEASGAPHIVQLVYFGEGMAQVSAVALMCYLALHVGESEALAKAEPLPALKGFAKNASLSQNPDLEKLISQAITHLEIFHAKGFGNHSDSFYHEQF